MMPVRGNPQSAVVRHLQKQAEATSAQNRYYKMLMEDKTVEKAAATKVKHGRVVKSDVAVMNTYELVEFASDSDLRLTTGFTDALESLGADGADLAHITATDLTEAGMSGFHARKAIGMIDRLCCD
jgi:hypothetical protein